ncbi:aggregation-promoting factor C-terminal-like domain-containing protein [Nocardiopsis lambiniae]|uniref:Lytic transglycosylase domain-containing protein n=1 Tax=Nocardiopsis lambiniae TaxID=3075539 RepID=A0ABU2M5M1_9ACTN|nr:transglycosylase SLT domain-containing protein [Nocardiopsis sp. DSM 44743]MDT0327932.1 lytic transglycosylase domain-containing protein [Nocardiopsis sp. DSM 44743]
MPLPRIPPRHASLVGAAVVLVAGGAFGVAAFADTEAPDPRDAASAAQPAPSATAQPGEESDDFFRTPPATGPEEDEAALEQAREAAEEAGRDAVRTGGAEASDILKEPEPEPEPESEGSGSSGGSAPVPAGSAKEIALQLVLDQGWAASEFSDCLEPLWEKESNWNHTAQNPGSGAYGIPQSLPGDKMASHGDDWRTNPATQISWGIDYIKGRYGTPCGAWSHSQANNWY